MDSVSRFDSDNYLPLVIGLVGTLLALSLAFTPLPLIFLFLLPALFYFLTRPYELLLVMTFLIPFNFVFQIGPIPVATELLKVFAWIPFLVTFHNRKQSFKTSKHNACFVVVILLLILSLLRSGDLPFTVKECVRLASDIGLCYIAINLVTTKEKLVQLLKVLTCSSFLVACYGFYQFAIQDYGALFWIVNPRMDTGFSHGRFAFWPWRGRITSVLTSEMELGHYFNLCIPLAIAVWVHEVGNQARSKWLLMTIGLFLGLLLTFTFGAWLALVVAAAGFTLLLDSHHRKAVIVMGIIICFIVCGLVAFGPLQPFVTDKLLGSGIGSLAWDVFTRLDSWFFAMKTWWSHPIFGVGVGNYEILEYAHEFIHSEWGPSGSSPHQTYLYILAQTGVVGLVSILIVLIRSIRDNLRFRSEYQLGIIGLGLAFALVVNMLGGFSDDSSLFGPHTSYLVWLIIGLSEALANLQPSIAITGSEILR